MSVRKGNNRRVVCGVTTLAVLFALVVPLAGTALAQHVSNVLLTPESDSAPAGTCNAFTVTLTGPVTQADPNPGVPGETIDVIVQDADADNPATSTGAFPNEAQSDIIFCTPPSTQQGTSDEFGPNPRPNTPNQTTFSTTGPGAGGQGRAQTEFCCTDPNGQLTFGIQSSVEGNFSVTAFFDQRNESANPPATDGDDNPTGDFADTSTKSFTAPPAQGSQGVRTLDCNPESDLNPEGTTHTFNCVATDANGNNVSGATISFDVTTGPNAEEVGPTTCFASSTNAQGQTTTNFPASTTTTSNGQATCSYTDTETNNDNNANTADTSPPGTDTIVGFVNQSPGSGQTGTPGADTFEPQDSITKTFVGDANTLECEGEEGDTAIAGGIVEIECTVTDASGQPVPNVDVDFDEDGAGVFRGPTECTTGATGTCSIQIETDESEAGESVDVTATIEGDSFNNADANGFTGDTNCTSTGVNNPGTSADCTDTVTILLGAEVVPTDCNDGVDNDGDGRIDFPNDAGCTSADDATETGEPDPTPTEVRRSRTLEITALRHVTLPGKSKPALLVKGNVSSANFDSCATEVPIKIQIRAGGEWITRKSDTTNANGVFKVLVRDVQARYRAVATKFQIEDTEANELNICLKASDTARHNH